MFRAVRLKAGPSGRTRSKGVNPEVPSCAPKSGGVFWGCGRASMSFVRTRAQRDKVKA